MQMTEIKRESLGPVEFDEPVCSLADEAKEVLGYERLKQVVTGEVEGGELKKSLSSCGLEVLNKTDVERYQTEHLKEIAQKKFAAWLNSNESVKSFGGRFDCPAWLMTPIEKYKEAIPEFVLNKAIQIKKAMPNAGIFIEYLDESPDPFLVVKTQKTVTYTYQEKENSYQADDEMYYIEVWAEPKFEGRL